MKLLRFLEFFLSNIQILLKTKPKISKEIAIGKFLTKYMSSHEFETVFQFLIGSYRFVRLQIFFFITGCMSLHSFSFSHKFSIGYGTIPLTKQKRILGELYLLIDLENLEKVLWS